MCSLYKTDSKIKYVLLTFFTILSVSSNSKDKKVNTSVLENTVLEKSDSQIGEYVVETFQDSKGNIWFGTRVA